EPAAQGGGGGPGLRGRGDRRGPVLRPGAARRLSPAGPGCAAAWRIAYLFTMQEPRLLVLAFSGGLDTSYCVPRLAEAGWTVHTCHVDTGGATAAEADAIRAQAGAVGAARHHHVDARAQVFDRFVRF